MEHKLEVLGRIAAAFRSQNITWALGASGLLYFKGIVTEFHDLDIQVIEEDVERAAEILRGMGEQRPFLPNAGFKTRHFLEFAVEGVDIDLMAGFVIVKDGREFDCTFTADGIDSYADLEGEAIPLQSLDEWKRIYLLLGRPKKADIIKI